MFAFGLSLPVPRPHRRPASCQSPLFSPQPETIPGHGQGPEGSAVCNISHCPTVDQLLEKIQLIKYLSLKNRN